MFGPLNGVRSSLVVAAFLTAIVSALTGQVFAAVLLLAAVAVHGAGWWYLYQRHSVNPASSENHQPAE